MSIAVVFGTWGAAQPAYSQALAPHILTLDSNYLTDQGLNLAQEAAQLAQFQQFELALPKAQLATQLVPDNSQVWLLLGNLYRQVGDVESSIDALQQSRSLEPSNASILFALGSSYLLQDQYSEAIEYLQAGLRIEPDVPGALFDLGNAYYMAGQYEAAIVEYEEAIIGIYFNSQRYEEAIALDAEFWPAVNNIGLVLYEQGDDAGALDYWQAAVDIDEMQAEPQLAIAIVLYEQGQEAQGLALGEAALRLDQRYADLEFLRRNLWGDRLLEDAQAFLSLPQMRQTISSLTGATF